MESPFWQTKFKGLEGKPVWLSTKQTDYRKAIAVAERWEKAVQLASDWELRNKQKKILDDIWELTKSLAPQQISKRLLNDLLTNAIAKGFRAKIFTNFALSGWQGKGIPHNCGEHTEAI